MTKEEALKFLDDTLMSDDYENMVQALAPETDCPHDRIESGKADVCAGCGEIQDFQIED